MENLAVLAGGRQVLIPPPGRGFVPYPETPRLVIDKSLGRAPADWELFHDYRLVSDRMKSLLEELDLEGVRFVRCETRYRDGRAAPTYWLCDVVRVLDAVDEAKSVLEIEYPTPGRKVYNLRGRSSLVFKEDSVGAAHIFRLLFYPTIICDQVTKDACKEAGMKGIGFTDATKY
ncbi:imm11 family protein [Bradyrhizobium tunisiense]|uniref:imm11 family protein n=1 Tax=Bradyrhizobium tunisiense TaxID=3278709 RepID=UPI0035D9F7FD